MNKIRKYLTLKNNLKIGLTKEAGIPPVDVAVQETKLTKADNWVSIEDIQVI